MFNISHDSSLTHFGCIQEQDAELKRLESRENMSSIDILCTWDKEVVDFYSKKQNQCE